MPETGYGKYLKIIITRLTNQLGLGVEQSSLQEK
jgi:hypothetical protein